MARGTQHRKRRPPANARVAASTAAKPKRPKRPAYEEQLFFGRLRGHAKWMFVLLAVVFALSFVFLGVGSGSTGISDDPPELLQRQLRRRLVALVAPEEDGRRTRRTPRLARPTRPSSSRRTSPTTPRSRRSRPYTQAESRRTRARCASSPGSTCARAATGDTLYTELAARAPRRSRRRRRAEPEARARARQGARRDHEPARDRAIAASDAATTSNAYQQGHRAT